MFPKKLNTDKTPKPPRPSEPTKNTLRPVARLVKKCGACSMPKP